MTEGSNTQYFVITYKRKNLTIYININDVYYSLDSDVYNWITVLHTRNEHNIINQLYLKKNLKNIWPIQHACMLSCFSHIRLFGTLWTITCQPALSLELSKQEYWSGLPCPPSGILPDPGIRKFCLLSPALAGGLFTTSATWEAPNLSKSFFFFNEWR